MAEETKRFYNALTGETTYRTYNTEEQNGHPDFVKKYFPEYSDIDDDGGNQQTRRITQPWQAGGDGQHIKATANMSEGEKVAYYNAMNWYRNGGQDGNGNNQLDPSVLSGAVQTGRRSNIFTTKDGGTFNGGSLPSDANPYGVNSTYNGQEAEAYYGYVHTRRDTGEKSVPGWNTTARLIGHESWAEGPGDRAFRGIVSPFSNEKDGTNITGAYGYQPGHPEWRGYQEGQIPNLGLGGLGRNTPPTPKPTVPTTPTPTASTTPRPIGSGAGGAPPGAADAVVQGVADNIRSASTNFPQGTATPSPTSYEPNAPSAKNAPSGSASSAPSGWQTESSSYPSADKRTDIGGHEAAPYARPIFTGPQRTSNSVFDDLSNRGIGRGNVPGNSWGGTPGAGGGAGGGIEMGNLSADSPVGPNAGTRDNDQSFQGEPLTDNAGYQQQTGDQRLGQFFEQSAIQPGQFTALAENQPINIDQVINDFVTNPPAGMEGIQVSELTERALDYLNSGSFDLTSMTVNGLIGVLSGIPGLGSIIKWITGKIVDKKFWSKYALQNPAENLPPTPTEEINQNLSSGGSGGGPDPGGGGGGGYSGAGYGAGTGFSGGGGGGYTGVTGVQGGGQYQYTGGTGGGGGGGFPYRNFY